MRLIARPTQLIECIDGVLLKRGSTQVKITGEGSRRAIETILEATSGQGATQEQLCDLFSPPARSNVLDLINQLIARRFLETRGNGEAMKQGPETNEDVFFWQFAASASKVREGLATINLLVLGINCITRQLLGSLQSSGFLSIRAVDHPAFRNARLFDGKNRVRDGQWPESQKPPEEWTGITDPATCNCLIAASDFGTPLALLELNKCCLEQGIRFLPITLHNCIGHVGPLVLPNEGACLQCLHSRQNANLDDPSMYRLVEAAASERQDVVGFHASMASVLGDISAIELTKFFTGGLASLLINGCITVDLMAGHMTTRTVLKVPRCPACSPCNMRPPTSATKSQFEDTSRFAP